MMEDLGAWVKICSKERDGLEIGQEIEDYRMIAKELENPKSEINGGHIPNCK